MNKYKIVRDDAAVSVTPCDALVKDFLTLTEKKMVVQGWQRKTVYQKLPFHRVLEEDPNTCISYQGVWKSLSDHLKEKGHDVVIVDKRKNFPVPDLTKIRGLRYGQLPLVLRFLMANSSGLFGAVTRYG